MNCFRWIVGCSSLLVLTAPLAAVEIILNPTRDTSIFSESNNSAGGTTATPVTQGKTSIYSGNNGNGQSRRSLLAFNQIASQIPAGATITSATLTLQLASVPMLETSPRSFALYRLSGDWGEGSSFGTMGDGGMGGAPSVGDATWNFQTLSSLSPIAGDPWTTPGGDFGLSTAGLIRQSPGGGIGIGNFDTDVDGNPGDDILLAPSAELVVGLTVGDYIWSSPGLAADVQAWLNNPTSNFGWILLGPEDVVRTSRRFASSETADASIQPRLTINYTLAAAVPEPTSSIVMLISVFALLFGYRLIRSRS